MKSSLKLLYLIASILIFYSSATSEPLTIVDEKGLIRGVADVTDIGDVKIVISSSVSEPFLTNIDGISPSKHPDKSESDQFIFLSVPRGKWRIDGLNESEIPSEVIVTRSEKG